MNAWDHLPNAKHIDRILDSVKRNPRAWVAAWSVIRGAAWAAAWDAAYNAAWAAARDAARDAAWAAARDAAWAAAWDAAWNAILALIAYDDIAYMLDSTLDELRVLSALGDDRATLMLPAVIVFNEEKITLVG